MPKKIPGVWGLAPIKKADLSASLPTCFSVGGNRIPRRVASLRCPLPLRITLQRYEILKEIKSTFIKNSILWTLKAQATIAKNCKRRNSL